jgi:hypothetical protein
MPEFILDPTVEFNLPRTLDTFTRAYIECLYFTSTGPDDDTPDDAELAPSTLATIVVDCADFQQSNATMLRVLYGDHCYDESRAGHDFWLTRNRHGAGFWDRGLGDSGRFLTEQAHAYGSVDAYAGDDGLIYLT